MKLWRKLNLKEALKEQYEVEGLCKLEKMTDFHWRMNGKIDIWPSTKKYMMDRKVRHYNKLKDLVNL